VGSHLEHSHHVGGPETVLQAAQRSNPAVGVSLQVEDDVDHVLEQLGPGDAAFLGDVTDEDRGNVAIFGETNQAGGALPDLGDPTRCPGGVWHAYRLDRVDDHQVGRVGLGRGQDAIDVVVGNERDIGTGHRQALSP